MVEHVLHGSAVGKSTLEREKVLIHIAAIPFNNIGVTTPEQLDHHFVTFLALGVDIYAHGEARPIAVEPPSASQNLEKTKSRDCCHHLEDLSFFRGRNLKKLVKETDIKCKFGNCLKDKMFKRVTTSKYETNVYVLHYDCSPEK